MIEERSLIIRQSSQGSLPSSWNATTSSLSFKSGSYTEIGSFNSIAAARITSGMKNKYLFEELNLCYDCVEIFKLQTRVDEGIYHG